LIANNPAIEQFSNVIVVDDSPEKIQFCPSSKVPIDYYKIDTFEATPISMVTDRGLLTLRKYLEDKYLMKQ